MEPYITFKDTDKDNVLQYYVLQRAFPHYCGVILTVPQADSLMTIPFPGYHLYLTFSGTLAGNYLLSRRDMEVDLLESFTKMADWYFRNRIAINEKRYKKFKI